MTNIMTNIMTDISKYKLKPLDFSRYETGFHKNLFTMTTKNPFKTMNEQQWNEYVSTREPHFTNEPYYDIIPWEKLQQIEIDAKNAGWELILRTTNNTAFCPSKLNYKWFQSTKWIFGYPGMQILLILSYTENKFTLINEKKDEDIELTNYFSLSIISSTKPQKNNSNDYYKDYDWESDIENFIPDDTYYDEIKPATGWSKNGGFIDNGTYDFTYIFFGKNIEKNITKLTDEEIKIRKENIITLQIPKTFWTEWIEYNKDILRTGKFEKSIQITNWDNTNVLPGGQDCTSDEIIKWHMSFLFIQKLLKTNIHIWVNDIFGYDCHKNINNNFWNPILPYNIEENTDLQKLICITEVLLTNTENNWIPFNTYKIPLLNIKDIQLSLNAKYLIEQMWTFIKSKN
jgi:hypothetical protein